MIDESYWGKIVRNFDNPALIDRSVEAIRALLAQAGEGAESVALSLGKEAEGLNSLKGKQAALALLEPYATKVPEIVTLIIDLSRDANYEVRVTAAGKLFPLRSDPRARARLFELVDDEHPDVQNIGLALLAQMDDLLQPGSATESALRVIPDDGERAAALDLLDALERAVKTLQDLGLDDSQDEIIDELILPVIGELKALLARTFDTPEVNQVRKGSLISIGRIVGAAHGVAVTTAALANAGPAAQAVKEAAQALMPIAETIGAFLR